MMPNERECIYCLQEKPADQFSVEHIIPQFLGGTREHRTLVTDCVCKKCNSDFGRFVDAAVAKAYFMNFLERGFAEGCFDFDRNYGNIFPLLYFGRNKDLSFVPETVSELWLGPDAGTIWHLRGEDTETFLAYAGGDPVARRKSRTERVYAFLASSESYWVLSALRSAKEHFKEQPLFLGTDSDLEATLAPDRKKGVYCIKDAAALRERDHIRAVLDRDTMLGNQLQIDLIGDVRFLAKTALAFGWTFGGSDYLSSRHSRELRRILRTPRSKLKPNEWSFPIRPYATALDQAPLRHISFPLSFVFLIKHVEEFVSLCIISPSGRFSQIPITFRYDVSDNGRLASLASDTLFISVPALRKVYGPFEFAEYMLSQLGQFKIAELQDLRGRITTRDGLPQRVAA